MRCGEGWRLVGWERQGSPRGASSFPTRPSCTGIDCPKFTVVNTTDDYEVRYYESGGLPA